MVVIKIKYVNKPLNSIFIYTLKFIHFCCFLFAKFYTKNSDIFFYFICRLEIRNKYIYFQSKFFCSNKKSNFISYILDNYEVF